MIVLQKPDRRLELDICFLLHLFVRFDSTSNGLIAFFLHTYKAIRARYEYTLPPAITLIVPNMNGDLVLGLKTRKHLGKT